MLRKFAFWFICFGLSYFVANVMGLCEQGEAFLYVYLGASVMVGIILIIALLIFGGLEKELPLAGGLSLLVIAVYAVIIVITLFATWGATQIFGVDFFVTFEIMTFGQCLSSSDTSISKEKPSQTYYL